MFGQRVKLGQKVKDKLTGLEGTAVARCEYLYGCVRISVQPFGVKDGQPAAWVNVDEPQLEVIKEKPVKAPRGHGPAGPQPATSRAPDPSHRA